MKNLKDIIQEKLVINKDIKTREYSDDPKTWEVGDILAGTAGYSMCLPRFYKVIKKSGSTFTVTRMQGKIVYGHKNGQWQEIPDETAKLIDKETYRGRITKWGGLKIDGTSVHLWNGKPLYGDDMD